MNDQPNLRQFLDEVNSFGDEGQAAAAPVGQSKTLAADRQGARDRRLGLGDLHGREAPAALQSHSDPSVAMSGQVGSQVKMIVGNAG